MPHDIFISYSRRDLAAVKPVKEELERLGFSCWMDLDGIESGDGNFKRKIVPALDRSKTVLFFISADSQKSEWTEKELDYAKRHKKRVVPLRFNDDSLVGVFDFDYGGTDHCRLAYRRTAGETVSRSGPLECETVPPGGSRTRNGPRFVFPTPGSPT